MECHKITKKLFALSLAACLTVFFAGCSDPVLIPGQLEKFESCVNSLNWHVDFMKSHGYDKIDPNTKDETQKIEKDELYLSEIALKETRAYVDRIKKSGKLEKFSWYLNADEKRCPFDTIASITRSNQARVDSSKQEQNLDAMNREIDAAQDSVLEEYRRKAVKHSSTSGAGAKVDTFLMKGGSIVICKTTVTNGGKAVDCH